MKRRFTYIIVALMMTMLSAAPASAAAIEQIGDRYIIHVDELNLTGEETLAEVLAMFPNVVDFDNLGANLVVRTNEYGLSAHNMGYTADYEQFLAKTKAKEIDRIQVCTNAGTMKGTEGVGKVIDVYYKKGKNGTSGRVSVTADSYGSLTSFNTVKVERDNLTVWGQLMGGLKHKKVNDYVSHIGNQAAVAGIDWHIDDNNKFMAQVCQSFSREHDNTVDMRTYSRDIDVNLVYDLDLFDKRGYMEIQTVFINEGSNSASWNGRELFHSRTTSPIGVIEFGIPLYKDKALLMAGVEGGLSKAFNDDLTMYYNNRQLYYDVYGQIDWNIHGVNVSIGDRVRTVKYYQNENEDYSGDDPNVRRSADHRHRNHFFNFAVYGNITKHSVLKGSFAKAPVTPSFMHFLYQDDPSQDYWNYRSSVRKMDAYISEVKYEYQKPDFIFTTFVNNSHVNFDFTGYPTDHINIFQVGASTYWHKGILRLSAALNYYNVMNRELGEPEYSNVVQVRLQPSIALQQGWQIVPLLSYTSFARLYGMGQPAQFAASLRVTKKVKNWDFDLLGNNLGHQRFGHRSVSLGVTYNW